MARALVPRNELADSSTVTSSSSDPTRSSKRRCVVAACVPCRKRKSKCDAGTPFCATCTAVYQTECYYDTESETRRKTTAPPKRDATTFVEESHPPSSAAEVLIERLRSLPEYEIQGLVHRIREGEDMEALAASLSQQRMVSRPAVASRPVSQERDLSAYTSETTFMDGLRAFGSTSGMGQVPEQDSDTGYKSKRSDLHCESWTTVSKDQGFIRHLLQTYFEIYNPFFNFIAQGPFWDSFNAGSTKYCSPLLVNACCALACHSSERPAARTDPKDHRTAGDHFFAEARQLLFDDEDPCLTMVQALAVLALREPAAGRDSSGYMYAGRCVRVILELGLHLKGSGSGTIDPIEEEVRSVTCWGVFNFETMWTLCVGRITQIPRAAVTRARPAKEPVLTGMGLDPNAPRDSFVQRQLLHYTATLSELSNDNTFMFYAPRERFTAAKLLDAYSRYRSWHRSLPTEFQPKHMNKNAPPARCVLEFMMWYQACLIMLFRPLIKVTLAQSEVVPREVCLDAANQITDLMETYRISYGLRRVNTLLAHINLSASMIHLIHLKTNTDGCRTRLIQDMKNLETMSECAYFSARAFRTIIALSQLWETEMPPEVYQNSKLVPSSLFAANNGVEGLSHQQISLGNRVMGELRSEPEAKQHPYRDLQASSVSIPQVSQPPTLENYPPASAPLHYSSYPDGKTVPAPQQLPFHQAPHHQALQHQLSQQQESRQAHPQASGPPSATAAHFRPADASAAEQLFWTPFGGHTAPLLGTNFNTSPMDLSSMLGQVDQWEQLTRDGFRFDWAHNTAGQSGAPHGSYGPPPTAGAPPHGQAHTGRPEEQGRSGEHWSYGNWQ